MTQIDQPILVSFKLCPFVQRSVITLLYKKIEFTLEYIDLDRKPDWFVKISPLGKVPLLRVADAVLFESAVINEYLDEVYGDTLLPSDPLEKAQFRAWIEFSSSLNKAQHQLAQARREDTFRKIQADLSGKLIHLSQQLDGSGFFKEKFSLVDSAFAPFLMRSQILFENTGEDSLEDFKPLMQWRENLLSLDCIKDSVVEDFEQLYMDVLNERGGFLSET